MSHLPDVLHHGTTTPEALEGPCLPASQNRWWNRVTWQTFDTDFQEARLAYANIVWAGLGLREPGRPDAPDWARGIRTFRELGENFGILFVTDDPRRAETLYGPTVEIDMAHPSVLDVIEDPNALTHNAWVLVLRAGEPLPLMRSAPNKVWELQQAVEKEQHR
jgi:hypothetical protein